MTGPNWQPGGDWYRGVHAREEAARGLNPVEDLWAAGGSPLRLAPGDTAEVTAAAAPFDGVLPAAGDLVATARKRARELGRQAGADRRRRPAARDRRRPVPHRHRRPAPRPSPATRGSGSGRAT